MRDRHAERAHHILDLAAASLVDAAAEIVLIEDLDDAAIRQLGQALDVVRSHAVILGDRILDAIVAEAARVHERLESLYGEHPLAS